MSLVVHRTLALVDADGAAVELAEGDDMVYRAAAGMAGGCLGLRLQRQASLSGLCVAQGQALYCDDAELDPRTDRAACIRVGLRSMVVVPLRHQGETVGVLKAMSARTGHFDKRHVALLTLLSELVAASMYFATRYAPGELFHKATHDGLTDLPNRSLFLDRLRSSLAQGARDRQAFAVVILDMDGLKRINDTHGHRVGDAVLTEFARRLAAGVRQSDTAARLGGDEFALLLRPLAVDGGLQAMIDRLADQLNGSFEFEGARCRSAPALAPRASRTTAATSTPCSNLPTSACTCTSAIAGAPWPRSSPERAGAAAVARSAHCAALFRSLHAPSPPRPRQCARPPAAPGLGPEPERG